MTELIEKNTPARSYTCQLVLRRANEPNNVIKLLKTDLNCLLRLLEIGRTTFSNLQFNSV